MDSSFPIKPRPGVQKYVPRDPVPVREATEADTDTVKAIIASDGDGRRQQHDAHHDHAPHDHGPHDLVIDPGSREVINRENDVRTHANEDPHPDQALLRQRAYRPARAEAEPASAAEPHANIKA